MRSDIAKPGKLIVPSILAIGTSAVALIPMLGCQAQHPDDKSAVYQKLTQNDLASVEVSQDRHAGVITLKGVVGSQDSKKKAEDLAAQAAPGYTIQDQLTVQNTGITSMAKPNAAPPQVTTEPAK
ncbi:hypothetical protein DYQ86_00860 [Acidobacteria bacterium AB60]|nr:hypothetical protein DYQ86_00860 [Acidobacteria bacterium AB60]